MKAAKKSTVGVPVFVDVAPAEPAPARVKRESGPDKPRGVVDDFGTRPAGVTHWRCYRVSEDGTRAQDPLEHESSETEMGVSRFPIAELASSTIRKRWGGGRYSVEFLGPRQGKGTCIHLSWGQKVTIGDRTRRAQAEPVPVAAAPVAAPASDPLAMMSAVRQMAREESEYAERQIDARLTGLAGLAAVLAGNHQAAQQLAVQNQNLQLAQALNAINARLDRMESGASDDDDDDDDDEGDDEDDEDDDDEGDDEGDDDAPEPDTMTKVLQFFDKHGDTIKMGLEYFGRNPQAIPASLRESPAAATEPPPSGPQPTTGTTAT